MKGWKARRQATRRSYRVLVIVCEGTETERIYFNRLRKRGSNLQIGTPKAKRTDPVSLVKFAKTQAAEFDIDRKSGDQIWCVFDVDNNKQQAISDALKLAAGEVRLAVSNPCFELWYLLHFVDVGTKMTCKEAIDKLRRYVPNYSKSLDVFDRISPLRQAAIKRCKTLNSDHDGNGIPLTSVECNPSTQVFQLVEEIARLTDRFLQ